MPQIAAVLVAFAALLSASACSYDIQAPDEPVEVSVSWEFQQEISVILPGGEAKAPEA